VGIDWARGGGGHFFGTARKKGARWDLPRDFGTQSTTVLVLSPVSSPGQAGRRERGRGPRRERCYGCDGLGTGTVPPEETTRGDGGDGGGWRGGTRWRRGSVGTGSHPRVSWTLDKQAGREEGSDRW